MTEEKIDWHPVCPFCDHNHSDDVHEYMEGLDEDVETTIECENCGKEFKYSYSISITFTNTSNE